MLDCPNSDTHCWERKKTRSKLPQCALTPGQWPLLCRREWGQRAPLCAIVCGRNVGQIAFLHSRSLLFGGWDSAWFFRLGLGGGYCSVSNLLANLLGQIWPCACAVSLLGVFPGCLGGRVQWW